MNWVLKAHLQRLAARLPGGRSTYYIGQRLVGGMRNFSIKSKTGQWGRLVSGLDQSSVHVESARALEIGTGWAPIIPLLFWLSGQDRCDAYDVTQLLRPALVEATAQQLVDLCRTSAQPEITARFVPQRVALLQELVIKKTPAMVLLQQCGIHYHAPADASASGLANASLDLVYSNTVLEHVPQPTIAALFAEAFRVLRPGGVMVHLIDLSDHFAHADPSITSINFLQFSEQQFARYNTIFCYQNRLRPRAYEQMVKDQGFKILYWVPKLNERALEALPTLSISADFTGHSLEELCTSSICVVAQRP